MLVHESRGNEGFSPEGLEKGMLDAATENAQKKDSKQAGKKVACADHSRSRRTGGLDLSGTDDDRGRCNDVPELHDGNRRYQYAKKFQRDAEREKIGRLFFFRGLHRQGNLRTLRR